MLDTMRRPAATPPTAVQSAAWMEAPQPAGAGADMTAYAEGLVLLEQAHRAVAAMKAAYAAGDEAQTDAYARIAYHLVEEARRKHQQAMAGAGQSRRPPR